MGIARQKKQDFILNAGVYLKNVAADPYIKQQIFTIGYDENRLQEGLALQQSAEETRDAQLRLKNRARSLYVQLREIFALHLTHYIEYARLFRTTFIRNIAIKEKLGLYGPTKRNVPGFLEQARMLYHTLLKESSVMAQLEKFSITPESIQEKLAGLEAVEQAYTVYQGAEKESQDATDQSSRELGKLRDWIRELQDACRIVLKGKPQLLEKVGILVRSSKPSSKRETDGSGEQGAVSA